MAKRNPRSAKQLVRNHLYLSIGKRQVPGAIARLYLSGAQLPGNGKINEDKAPPLKDASPEPKAAPDLLDNEDFIKACERFPPLRKLRCDLEHIEETKRGRGDLDETLKVIFEFLSHIPTMRQDRKLDDLPLRRIRDLMFALADLDEGKAPALFRAGKAKNNNAQTGEGLAYDHIIAVRHYLIYDRKVSKLNQKEAHNFISQALRERGLNWVTPDNIDNWQHHHAKESSRKARRPDARNQQPDSDKSLDIYFDQIADLLRHQAGRGRKPPS